MTSAYNEIKQHIGQSDYESIRPRLLRIMHMVPTGNADRRQHVRSLYFGPSQDQAARTPLDDLQPRKLFRIRMYGQDDHQITFEKKNKVFGSLQKQSVPLTRDECDRLLGGDLEWLAQTRHPLLLEFHAANKRRPLVPHTLVDMWRETYVYPYGNVTVTFSSDIRSAPYEAGLFDQLLPKAPSQMPQPMLMEVTYEDFLPESIAAIVGDGWNPPGVTWAPVAVGSIL